MSGKHKQIQILIEQKANLLYALYCLERRMRPKSINGLNDRLKANRLAVFKRGISLFISSLNLSFPVGFVLVLLNYLCYNESLLLNTFIFSFIVLLVFLWIVFEEDGHYSFRYQYKQYKKVKSVLKGKSDLSNVNELLNMSGIVYASDRRRYKELKLTLDDRKVLNDVIERNSNNLENLSLLREQVIKKSRYNDEQVGLFEECFMKRIESIDLELSELKTLNRLDILFSHLGRKNKIRQVLFNKK